MKKRINFTGRQKLPSENIDIRLLSTGEITPPSFTAKLDPASMKNLDANAKVYVEPYVGASSMRFDFGTASCIKHPFDTTMSEIDERNSILFRVKVVDESGTVGKILAVASALRALNPDEIGDNRKSLFPTDYLDLGEAIWKLQFDPQSGPVLQLTTKIVDLPMKMKSDALVQGMIYPQLLREILFRWHTDGADDDDLPWVQNWTTFIHSLTGRNLADDPIDDQDQNELSDFIDIAVKAFCNKHLFGSRAKSAEGVAQ